MSKWRRLAIDYKARFGKSVEVTTMHLGKKQGVRLAEILDEALKRNQPLSKAQESTAEQELWAHYYERIKDGQTVLI